MSRYMKMRVSVPNSVVPMTAFMCTKCGSYVLSMTLHDKHCWEQDEPGVAQRSG